jgi:hypothetical protein
MREPLSDSRWPARIIVLVTGIAFGMFAWRAYVNQIPRLYPVEFTHAQWLTAPDNAPQGYFRQELYISEAIQQAWVIVAATDSFILYLNGKAVDGKGYASLHVSGIYDIGPYLVLGKNVLSVATRRLSYPGPAMAAVEGVYRDHSGREHRFASDADWKFSPLEETQGHGETPWYAETFDATAWQSATTAGFPRAAEIYPLSVHPLSFAMPPQGEWIGQAGGTLIQATFSYTLTLQTKAEDAWLRIAAGKPYALAINGIAIERGDEHRNPEDMRLLRFQNTPLWNAQDGTSTDLYHIAPFLRAGANHLSVTSSPRFPILPGLFVDGFVVRGGEILPFGSNASWTATAPSVAPAPYPGPHQAIPLTPRTPAYNTLPLKQTVVTALPLPYTAKQILTFGMVLLGTSSATYLLWMGSSRLLHGLVGGSSAQVAGMDAWAHLPSLLALSTFYLLSFDVRVDPAFPFQTGVIVLAAAALLLAKTIVVLHSWYHLTRHGPVVRPASPSREVVPGLCTIVLLLGLIAVGACFRLYNLDGQSLYHDEIHMVTYVQGLLEKGYPHKMMGPIERPLATYELAPYPIALAVTLLGMSDFTLRLPAALFGIMTIPLIFFVGQQVFDRRVGFLAAAVYTFCPQALIWSQYLWHPQQTQFLSLLTSYLFYQAIRHTPITPWYLYAAALTFIATYLSWEGTGFYLPALGLGVAVVKGKDLSWLRDKHLWIALGLVSLAVAIQLIRRLLLQIPYLVIGQGLSDVSLPSPYFLDPMYDPTFYLKNFLWLENNVVLTLLIVATLPLLFKHPSSAYYCTLLFTVLFLMANTLSNAAIRYVYYLQSFLILTSSAAVFFVLDYLTSHLAYRSLLSLRFLNNLITGSVIVLMTLYSSTFLSLYRLSYFSYPSGVHTRDGVYYIDYRGPSKYVRSEYQDGDLIISVVADALSYYVNLESHYFFQEYTMRQVFYDPTSRSSRYLERIVGNQVITSAREITELISDHRRVWVVSSPDSIFIRMTSPEVRTLIHQAGRIVYESYNSKVYLIVH